MAVRHTIIEIIEHIAEKPSNLGGVIAFVIFILLLGQCAPEQKGDGAEALPQQEAASVEFR